MFYIQLRSTYEDRRSTCNYGVFTHWRHKDGGYLGVIVHRKKRERERAHKAYLRDNKQIRGLVSTETVVLHQWRSENSLICSDEGLMLEVPAFTSSMVANLSYQLS